MYSVAILERKAELLNFSIHEERRDLVIPRSFAVEACAFDDQDG